ncbi:hypothetical protein J5226_09960 [Lysobacter sp. K5869]|uniref:hypothetical protein n=1 Tax=Lysobacter sp. K5869 TaxID=2820808 RepID=UPI001C063269|nr:hypothetical protein [Lysobacter sp. K5869]QWP78688.1 hypothetical protein J5226_09960 [Lysobacter sp. K5869]
MSRDHANTNADAIVLASGSHPLENSRAGLCGFAVAARAAPTWATCRSGASRDRVNTNADATILASEGRPLEKSRPGLCGFAVAARAAPTWATCRSGASRDRINTNADATIPASGGHPLENSCRRVMRFRGRGSRRSYTQAMRVADQLAAARRRMNS